MALTWTQIVAFARTLPGVEESTSYGSPSLKVRGKLLTRLRTEDDSLVLLDVAFEERAHLLAAAPRVFHLTPHYQDYPIVLGRLGFLTRPQLRFYLERRWRSIAGKRLVASKGG